MVQSNSRPHPREDVAPPILQKSEPEKFSFSKLAADVAYWAGTSAVFLWACAGIVLWGVMGPRFHYSDTWQLVVNTSTTIVTFLMVFLIQNTQNRDSIAMQIKLDELLRAAKGAETAMADLEDLTEEELEAFQAHYRKLAEAARGKMRESEGLPFAKARTAPPKSGSRPAGD
jgi:low affinity Fe/Cu permease